MWRPTLAAIVAVCLLCHGCGITKHTPPTAVHRDSTIVEYRERIVHDTVEVQSPGSFQERTTPDTVSVLSNEYARSSASVQGGLLTHDLEVFPKIVRVPVAVEVHDTTVVTGASDTVTEYVEVERELTRWQDFKMRTGGFALGILLILAILSGTGLIPAGRR